MWEIAAAVIGLIGTIWIFIVKRTLDNFKGDIGELKKICKLIPTLDEKLESQKERLDSITRDHSHLEDLLDELSKNLAESNSTNAGVKESVNGLRELLQHIITGNLIIRKR